jgi:hypothetical protein
MSSTGNVMTWPMLRSAARDKRFIALRDGRHVQAHYADEVNDRMIAYDNGTRIEVSFVDVVSLVGPKENQCKGKRNYEKHGAKKARDQMQARTGIRLMIYHCPHCGFWHLGNSSETKRKKMEREQYE